jgi:hypothetical protein
MMGRITSRYYIAGLLRHSDVCQPYILARIQSEYCNAYRRFVIGPNRKARLLCLERARESNGVNSGVRTST